MEEAKYSGGTDEIEEVPSRGLERSAAAGSRGPGPAGRPAPGAAVDGVSARIFRGLVLGCIEAKFCKYICV